MKIAPAFRKFKHGYCAHGENKNIYDCWVSLKQRCLNPKAQGYKNYGGRGIRVCDRWIEQKYGFINFLSDMGEPPSNRFSLDRINNDGNYEPSNCRWATWEQQILNRRKPVIELKEHVYSCAICNIEFRKTSRGRTVAKFCSDSCRKIAFIRRKALERILKS